MASARTVVVTGAASGIGAAIANMLAGTGWRVFGVDRSAPAGPSPAIAFHQCDLADVAAVAALGRELTGAGALVHAAGFMRTSPLDAIDTRDGDAMWAVHVGALAGLARELAPQMPVGGRIVAIGSRTSSGAAGKGLYAATKAGVVGLARSLAIELVGRGITVNVVSPAATATPLLGAADRKSVAPKMPPIGRFIEPDEIAATVAFLLSPGASAITGQDIVICGGASL